jgi:hypothetical protein
MTEVAGWVRGVRGVFLAIACVLLLTFDSVWKQSDVAFLIGWMAAALLVLLAVAYQCAVTLARSLYRSRAELTFDTVFWVVFLVLPSALWGIVVVCEYLWQLLVA